MWLELKYVIKITRYEGPTAQACSIHIEDDFLPYDDGENRHVHLVLAVAKCCIDAVFTTARTR